MKRLVATLRCDVRLQFRNGFYYAAGFVVALWLLLVTRLPALDWRWLLPAVVLNNLVIGTFFFVAGLVLLEKGEGSLEALVVTPLRHGEYLLSKSLTLTGLALLENLLIVGVLVGFRFNGAWLAAGTVLAGWMFCLFGFLAVVRYASINEFLLPATAYVAMLLLPLAPYFGFGPQWLGYLHPVQAPLVLLQGALLPVEPWQLVYAMGYGTLWLVALHRACGGAFTRFVAPRAGGE